MESAWKKRRLIDNSSHSMITEVYLLGFAGVKEYPQILGFLFFVVFIFSVFGNMFVFYVIRKERKLHNPMYIIISNLALSDIAYCIVIMPKTIEMYLFNNYVIHFNTCVVQMSFLHFIAVVECFLLVAMALDRYFSICNPLRYPSIITHKVTYLMCFACWVLALISPGVLLIYFVGLPFCGPNKVQHFYCEFSLVVRLACVDTTSNINEAIKLALIVWLSSFSIICYSYLRIITTIFKVVEPGGRSKAFYTCSTQLLVICILIIPRLFSYISLLFFYMPSELRIALGVFYSIFPPFIHPVIYSLRTKEIQTFILKSIGKKKIIVQKVRIENICS